MPLPLPEAPRAETYTVTELVRDAGVGRLRVPPFQRPLKWTGEDVAMLLDSLARGYPIGSLLLWRGRPVPPGPAQLGPVTLPNPATDEVRWLVDGQQRVAAVALALTKLGQGDPRFRIWFDPDTYGFHARPPTSDEPWWIPAYRLFDAAELQEFLFTWARGTPERRRAVLAAGDRIRAYSVPTYVVSSPDERPLREVFRRLNRQGASMAEVDVFDALAEPGARLHDLATITKRWGWGTLERRTLLKAALVNAGQDPTRTIDEAAPEPDTIAAWTGGLDDALRRTVTFLRGEGQIACVDLLPYELPLVVLPSFFLRHPTPSARSRRLLRRWLWRCFFLERPSQPSHLLHAARVVQQEADEEQKVQALLQLVPRTSPSPWVLEPQRRARSDSAHTRLGLLGLASLEPRRLDGTGRVDLVDTLGATGRLPQLTSSSATMWSPTLANRLIHPAIDSVGPARLWRILREGSTDAPTPTAYYASHAIDDDARRALRDDDPEAFLDARARAIERATNALVDACAEWGAHDRPSLVALFG